MALLKFVLIRLSLAVPTVAVVATLTFGLLQIIPGSPASFILGTSATDAQVAALETQLGLDQPLPVQYWNWTTDAVHGDFGQSVTSNLPSMQLVWRAVPVTLSVALLALGFTLVAGVGLGMLAALRGGFWDSFVQTLCSLAMATPAFWLAALLIYLFAIKHRVFYATDYTPLAESPMQWILHVTLPAVAVGATSTGQVAFQARAAFRESLQLDFVRTLRSTGLPPVWILLKHVLRNGLIPVVAMLGMMFVFMLGGVVIVESIFSLPGLGSLMLRSVSTHDLSTVQATVVTFTVMVVITNLFADLVVGWLDPRVRSDV